VYAAVKRAQSFRFIPIKGIGGMDRSQIDGDPKAIARRAASRIRSGAHPEPLGVDAIKRTVYHYLAADQGKPGYSHFPIGRDQEYYQQLTGERLIVVSQRGKRPARRWTPIHTSVEALDCRVYAYAAMLLMSPDWDALTRAEARKKEPPNAKDPTPSRPKASGFIGQPRSGWIRR
jgi:phage terminase large subunit GpA-like protein